MECKKIGEIATLSQGIQVPIEKQSTINNSDSVRFLRIIDYTQNKDEVRYIDNPGEKYLVDDTDVVMIRYGDAGKVVRGYKGAIANNLFKISIPENLVIKEYLYYYLSQKCIYERLVNNQQKTGLPAVNFKTVNDIEISFPKNLETQKKIVEVLDKAQELIDKRKEQIEELDELVKSRFIEMFGDKNKFQYIKIEDLVKNKSDIVDGPFGSNLKTVDYVDSGVRVIQINNIGECEFRDKNKKYVTEDKFNSLIKHSVIPGDIVVAKMGEPIGRACILPSNIEKAIIVADCMKIRPNTDIVNTKYLEFLLNSEEVKSQFKKYSQGSTRVRLNLTMLRQVKVLYPDIKLQNQFADFANKVDKLKFQMETSLKELEDNFNYLMQKAFKGELF